MKDFTPALHRVAHPIEQGTVVGRNTSQTPHAAHIVAGIGHRSYQRYLLIHRKRKQTSLVLHQHEGFTCHLTRFLAVLGRKDFLLRTYRVAVFVGVVKKSHSILSLKHPTTGTVNISFRNESFLQCRLQSIQKTGGYHIHVRSCLQSKHGSLFLVGHAVSFHLSDGIIIGNDHTAKSPLVTKKIGQQPLIGSGRNAIHKVERTHHAPHTRLNGCFIGSQIIVVHAQSAHVYRIIITSRLGSTIQCKMLDTGQYFIISLHSIALIAMYVCPRHQSAQVGIFTVPLGNASPTGIAADIHHRTEIPADSVGTGLSSRHACHPSDGDSVPATRHGKRYGEYCLITVYDIGSYNQGNLQTGFLHGNTLHLSDFPYSLHIEEARDFLLPYHFREFAVHHRTSH